MKVKSKEAGKKAVKKYQQSEKGKKTIKIYHLSTIGKLSQKNRNKKYHLTENGKIKVKKWDKESKQRYKYILHELKINGCAICGYNTCDRSLCFHHVDSKNKHFNLNITGMRMSDKSIIKELNKCILLCNNCHGELHYKLQGMKN